MLKVCGSPRIWILLIAAIASHRICRVRLFIRELTNRRLLHDAAVRLRDILSAHAFLSTCQRRAKGDDVAFSSPEAALLLVSTKNRDLWPVPTTF